MSPLENPAKFALAGNATFTIVSKNSGVRFTYRVRACEDNESLHFVQVLTGPDNGSDFTYLGTIRRGVYFHGKKSRISAQAPSATAFDWFWRRLSASRLPLDQVDVFHEGRCGRCGRPLTVPSSIESGFGPDCIGML